MSAVGAQGSTDVGTVIPLVCCLLGCCIMKPAPNNYELIVKLFFHSIASLPTCVLETSNDRP
jgi:hypothetical protein